MSDVVAETQLQRAAKEFVGDILLPPEPIRAVKSLMPYVLCNLKRTADMCVRPSFDSLAALKDAVARSEKPVTVHAFDVHYPSTPSPEIPFELVCDCSLEPPALIHAFGKKLGCDAMLYDLQRMAIGEYTAEQAWSYPRILKAFNKASFGPVCQSDRPHYTRLVYQGLRYRKRIIGCNWHQEFRSVKPEKIKPYEKRVRKRQREEMEREGLISDAEIMKRKLKKKAVKLVANLNVTAIEDVYGHILEE